VPLDNRSTLARPSRRVLAALFLEVAAALSLCLTALFESEARSYALANQAPRWFRTWSAILPWGAGLVALAIAGVALRRRPELAGGLGLAVRCAAPLLIAWAVPFAFDRAHFQGVPLELALLGAALVLGLERCLRTTVGTLRHALRSGRFEALRGAGTRIVRGRALPRLLAGLAILATFCFFWFGAVRAHDKMLTSNYDFGLFENLFYNTLHSRPGIALEGRYFAEHAEFLLFLLLPVYALAPASETLLLVQALLMAGAAVPLFLLAERWLKSGWAALVLALAYLCHPAVHGPAFYDFHFLPLSAFFILWAAYFHATKPGSWPFWLSAVLAMTCREDVALGAAFIGVGLFWCARLRKLGVMLAALGALWFVLVKFVWMRQFGPQSFTAYYADLIPPGERGFGAVLVTLLSNPLFALRRILTEQKLLLALQLLVPLAFLPLRYRRVCFLSLPGLIVVGLAASDSAIPRVHFHYSTHFLPYLFIAAVAALAVRARPARLPLLGAVMLGSVICSFQWGAFATARFRTSFHEISFDWTAEDEARKRVFEGLAARIPDGASVSAGEYEGPHLSRRATLHTIKSGTHDADFVIYSLRSLQWGGREAVASALTSGAYGVVDMAGDLCLLSRGHATARNADALRNLARR
jgi:uncharacterized membrane protein